MAKRKRTVKKNVSIEAIENGMKQGKSNFEKFVRYRHNKQMAPVFRRTAKGVKSNTKPYFIRKNELYILWFDPIKSKFIYAKWNPHVFNK